MAKEPKTKKTKTPLSQSDFERLVSRIASNMQEEAADLFKRDVENPKMGEKYYWNLRANILRDFANAIQEAMEG